ncbi:MAG: GNAT family N-acetyltransferase [Chloroflexi bacterium]|nr:GNAT family N-acetyltransferase [Chloroflexota bacterium]
MVHDEIVLRPLHPNDTADIYEMITKLAIAEMMNILPSIEYGENEAWLAKPRPGAHRFVAERAGKVIGNGNLYHFQRARLFHASTISLMIHPDFGQQGVGSKLLTNILDIADNWLDLKRIELNVHAHNEGAIKLYQKFGFEKEVTRQKFAFSNGKWVDNHIMARLRQADSMVPRATPAPIRPPKLDLSDTAVSIRTPLPADLSDLYQLSIHPAVGRTTMQMPSAEFPPFQAHRQPHQKGLYRYVAVVDKQVVGQAALHAYDKPQQAHSASLGMMVAPSHWGIGIGSKLMEALLELADNWLNLKRIDLEVNTDNPAGIHLYQKFGFKIEGTKRFHTYGDGRWADSHTMARRRE